ncbi:glycosyltransferase involved in cell wall biosynthesis [Allostreptomyces psammosilenae]|uniref:D-inositol 3-phosphate glycosyltransferase n=1 Tax=Allostreptomyces psammosilenae TaxID=1892865 RepID=A0A853ADS4_9ACTN|nr:glycosyltransferase involved in cell wall biosynthesis [Allostreptomyces psammosilenae]
MIGRDVPPDYRPPAGVEVVSASGGSGLDVVRAFTGGVSPVRVMASATPALTGPPGGVPFPRSRVGQPVTRALRWTLLPSHRQRVWRKWAAGARELAREVSYDVVHCHDFNTLPLGAELAERAGARLVYDAHEWWSGRQRHGRPDPWRRRRELLQERALAARADLVVTVSEGIAARLGRWCTSPVVIVRNTFPQAGRGPQPRPPGLAPSALVYAGRIGAGRDLETPLRAIPSLPGLALRLIGPADPRYAEELAALRGEGVEILPPRSVDAVDAEFRAGGLCLVTLTNSCDNHRLALPNKLFHAVRAGVPVIAADLPEMSRMVRRFGIGELYRPGDPVSFRQAVERAREGYPALAQAVGAARSVLAWERDAEVLLTAYQDAVRRP